MASEPFPDGGTPDCSPGCCNGTDRRQFLERVTLAAAAAVLPVNAGAAEPSAAAADFAKLIPPDKKLPPDWVMSLTARGEPAVYRAAELETIGMPVGGIGAGQVYLGGDGRLWLWDVFNAHADTGTDGHHYAHPPRPSSPFELGFAVRTTRAGQSETRTLDRSGFADVLFRGEYPIGRVSYRDAKAAVEVSLEAFSPFVPLDPDDSGLPASVLSYTLKNTSGEAVDLEVGGWLENPVCLHTARNEPVDRVNRVYLERSTRCTGIECSARRPGTAADAKARPEVVFEDFEKPTYEGWTVEGTAFGDGPIEAAKLPAYQGDVGAVGKRLVNSHNVRLGGDVAQGDAHTGRLTSREFSVERHFVRFLVGGGNHAGRTCVNLLVGGKVVRTAAGKNDNRMSPHTWDVRDLEGKTARIQIVDAEKGAWGNVGVDHIVFTDELPTGELADRPDFGTFALALLDAGPTDVGVGKLPAGPGDKALFAAAGSVPAEAAGPALRGGVVRKMSLAPGASGTVRFVVAWHMPNLTVDGLKDIGGRHYANRFRSARGVAAYVAGQFDRLARATRLWRDTWYDSTLPYWFLDRTFANTSTLATSTCLRLASGRLYGWEGVGCCPGTCTHVWHYAHAVARLFPSLEAANREFVDYGVSFNPKTGVIDFRGEFPSGLAVDGQAGTVLRAYREHQMSADDQFVHRVWPRVKRSLECLVGRDGNADGLIEGPQHNTLDAEWYGKVAWLSSLYLAALAAGEAMALEVGDHAFARRAAAILDAGRRNLLEQLYNGEYFIQVPDPAHIKAVGSFDGCSIDQVFGQSWAFQVGLGRVTPEKKTRSALGAIWKYNFTTDVGPYRERYKAGRLYALPGEGGTLMVTQPRGIRAEFKDHPSAWSAMYFNECMSGFEHQVAGHMLWEGMVEQGLALERAVHDRYHPSKRNPYNEVECGDHYARAMASYGVFLAACGWEYHGPQGHLGFAPRLSPEDFRAAFTAAEGWGTISQRAADGKQEATITMKHGRLRLRTVALAPLTGVRASSLTVRHDETDVSARLDVKPGRAVVKLESARVLRAGETLVITLH